MGQKISLPLMIPPKHPSAIAINITAKVQEFWATRRPQPITNKWQKDDEQACSLWPYLDSLKIGAHSSLSFLTIDHHGCTAYSTSHAAFALSDAFISYYICHSFDNQLPERCVSIQLVEWGTPPIWTRYHDSSRRTSGKGSPYLPLLTSATLPPPILQQFGVVAVSNHSKRVFTAS